MFEIELLIEIKQAVPYPLATIPYHLIFNNKKENIIYCFSFKIKMLMIC